MLFRSIAWSYKNCSPLVRIPSRRGIGTRIEIRNPDPACNPYLGLTAILAAGLDGIRQGLACQPAVEQNIYEMDLAARRLHGINSLPENLYEAINELMADQIICDAIGPHIRERFVQAKMLEWEEYSSRIYDWEIEQYLEKF